jgi:hypothetical protein
MRAITGHTNEPVFSERVVAGVGGCLQDSLLAVEVRV